MIIRNLTPHDVQIHCKEGILTIPAEKIPARCTEVVEDLHPIDTFCTDVSIPLCEVSYAKVTDLPEPKAGFRYIVSVLVAQALPDRDDLLVPYDLVRDERKRIVGCRKLARVV